MLETIGLIVEPPMRGSWNMAVDRALLERAATDGEAMIRIYQWEPATISLGYFQSYDHRQTHVASRNCPLVRRATGGGAIIHDREMTYSIVLPRKNRWVTEYAELLRRVHRSLIDCLEELGVNGCQVIAEAVTETRVEPFLCFQRRANGDVVLNDYKIIGSAQRRLKNALLQHGSVLIAQSESAPELPGINDLAIGAELEVSAIVSRWPSFLEREFGWKTVPWKQERGVITRAKIIEQTVFGSAVWTRKR